MKKKKNPSSAPLREYFVPMKVFAWSSCKVENINLAAPSPDCCGILMVYSTREACLREFPDDAVVTFREVKP